jgi:DNA repair protein RecO (recombination protein O)
MLPLVARYYDLHMLGMAGYQPQLFRCVACQELLEPVTNYVSVAEGGVLCAKHGEGRIGAEPLPLPLFKTLRFIQTREWDVVARLDLSAGLLVELERLLQSMLIYHLERNLRSVAFLRTVRDDRVTR